MQVINPGTIPVIAPDTAGGRFYDRHPFLIALIDIAVQIALIATLLLPLHRYVGNWDLIWTAAVFLGSLYIVWRILYERFLAPDHRRDYARGWLSSRPLVGVFLVLVVLPLRLVMLSAAMGAVAYDLVIDHGFHNPFGRAFGAMEALMFFLDQSFRRVLFDALATFGLQMSPLTLASDAAWWIKAALVPFRMAVEAISFGYVWYLVEPFWRAWKDRIARREMAARFGDGSDAPA